MSGYQQLLSARLAGNADALRSVGAKQIDDAIAFHVQTLKPGVQPAPTSRLEADKAIQQLLNQQRDLGEARGVHQWAASAKGKGQDAAELFPRSAKAIEEMGQKLAARRTALDGFEPAPPGKPWADLDPIQPGGLER